MLANGTATENSNFAIVNINNAIPVTGQKVTLSGCPDSKGTSKYGIYYYDTVTSRFDNGEGVTFIPEGVVTINARVYKGETVNDLAFRPQLELNSTKTPYEMYQGKSYTPSAKGVVDGINSISPASVLLTNTKGIANTIVI